MKTFFNQLLKDILEIFSAKNLIWHFLAIILTFILVVTNFDWNYFIFVQSHSFQKWFFPAVVLGGFLPFLVAFLFLIYGKIKKQEKYLKIGITLLKSIILAFLISGFYKALTGRPNPPHHFFDGTLDLKNLENTSHIFYFGFWRRGFFWGWPSTHTTLSFAFSLTLYKLYPKNNLIKTIVILYSFYVGIGISITAIHWFSEFIAGTIFGSLIGIIVSKNSFHSKKKICN